MTSGDFLSWLKNWLTRHPLKAPLESLQASYIEEVMTRIRATQAPAPAFRWVPRPQVAFALGTAFACALALLVVMHRAPTRIAQQIEREWQLLSEVGEDSLELAPGDLDEEIQLVDQLTLAQGQPALDDEAWVEQTLQLLERLESDEPLPASQDAIPAWDWLDELQWLDESELASS